MKLANFWLLILLLYSFTELSANKDRIELPTSYSFIFQNGDTILIQNPRDSAFEKLSTDIAKGKRRLFEANLSFRTGEIIHVKYDSFKLTDFTLANKKETINIPDSVLRQLGPIHYSSLSLLWDGDERNSWNAKYAHLLFDVGNTIIDNKYPSVYLNIQNNQFSFVYLENYPKIFIQLKEELNLMTREFQKKIDLGIQMVQISRKYNYEMDSMLTIVYKKVLLKNDLNKNYIKAEITVYYLNRKVVNDSLWKNAEVIFDETGIYSELEEIVAYGQVGSMDYEKALDLLRFLI